MRNCVCCPFGYHIDLDFVRYCESLGNAKLSEQEMLRRSRRRTRKSMEFMLGLQSIFDYWDGGDLIHADREVADYSETEELPNHSSYSKHRTRSSSVPRLPTYDGLVQDMSLLDSQNKAPVHNVNGLTNSLPETRAFLREALDEVCCDFERTLERASVKRAIIGNAHNTSHYGTITLGLTRDRNNNTKNSYAYVGCNTWGKHMDLKDSCISGKKSPRVSRASSQLHKKKLSPAEQQYESYVQATVEANNKSSVEVLAPTLPPRRQRIILSSPASENALSNNHPDTTGTDPHTLFCIRQQMALSLKRMKDLEEQVRAIPEMQDELMELRNEKHRLHESLKLKNEELHRVREVACQSPSPISFVSSKHSPVVRFTPQHISPISLESLGDRIHPNSNSCDRQLKPIVRRDIGTMCRSYATRDIAVGGPVATLRTFGTSPELPRNVNEERDQKKIHSCDEQLPPRQIKKFISVGTQMFLLKREMCDTGTQTAVEKIVLKNHIGITAKPSVRENFVHCKPIMRSVGSSKDCVCDMLCANCIISKCNANNNLDQGPAEKIISLKSLDKPGRCLTYTLGENAKLNIKGNSISTQCTQLAVSSTDTQTTPLIIHAVGVQSTPEMVNKMTQSYLRYVNRQTDTMDLIHLHRTQISIIEICPREVPVLVTASPPRSPTSTTSCKTDLCSAINNRVTSLYPPSTQNSASNTDLVQKRDVACGDIVKPHISISCADNYCDSCKDAIKHLAKDFSKVQSSPVPSRAGDSKIPRPKHFCSPILMRKQFQRQNTYTITPSPTPSPVLNKRNMSSSFQEKSSGERVSSSDYSTEAQNYINDHGSIKRDGTCSVTNVNTAAARGELKLDCTKEKVVKVFNLELVGENDLLVKEKTQVRVNWSREASPAALKTEQNAQQDASILCKSGAHFFHDQLQLARYTKESSTPLLNDALAKPVPSQIKCRDLCTVEEGTMAEARSDQSAPLCTVAKDEAHPRERYMPSNEMLSALRYINELLLKNVDVKSLSFTNLKEVKAIIQQDWFLISSKENANPDEVKDYLDQFESLSVPLLEYCVNMVDINGNTCMHYAVSHGHFNVVSILLDSKVCNVNQMNNAGYTCVMLVSLAKLKTVAHRIVVKRLFQMADVNLRAKKHCQTALMLAVSHGNFDMVDMLLLAGADINIQDEDGSTALMCAAEHGHVDIVKHLLSQADCDSSAQDIDGSTAFKIAWQAGHREVGLLLYVHEQMLRSKLPNRNEVLLSPAQ